MVNDPDPDPWTVLDSTPNNHQSLINCVVNTAAAAAFEDNFQPSSSTPPLEENNSPGSIKLPDSLEYLESLERKLKKLKSGSDILQELSARREHCLENLLRGSISLQTDADLGLDELSAETGRAEQIIRHIIPERAIHPIELVHIINYDQLQPDAVVDNNLPTVDDSELKEHSSSGSVSR